MGWKSAMSASCPSSATTAIPAGIAGIRFTRMWPGVGSPGNGLSAFPIWAASRRARRQRFPVEYR